MAERIRKKPLLHWTGLALHKGPNLAWKLQSRLKITILIFRFPYPIIRWSRMSGRRTSGTSRSSLGVQVLAVFLHFLGKIEFQNMSGKTPGTPRQPSSRHPRPSEIKPSWWVARLRLSSIPSKWRRRVWVANCCWPPTWQSLENPWEADCGCCASISQNAHPTSAFEFSQCRHCKESSPKKAHKHKEMGPKIGP